MVEDGDDKFNDQTMTEKIECGDSMQNRTVSQDISERDIDHVRAWRVNNNNQLSNSKS